MRELIEHTCHARSPTSCIYSQCPRHATYYNIGDLNVAGIVFNALYHQYNGQNQRARRRYRQRQRRVRRLMHSLTLFHSQLRQGHPDLPPLREQQQHPGVDNGYHSDVEFDGDLGHNAAWDSE